MVSVCCCTQVTVHFLLLLFVFCLGVWFVGGFLQRGYINESESAMGLVKMACCLVVLAGRGLDPPTCVVLLLWSCPAVATGHHLDHRILQTKGQS